MIRNLGRRYSWPVLTAVVGVGAGLVVLQTDLRLRPVWWAWCSAVFAVGLAMYVAQFIHGDLGGGVRLLVRDWRTARPRFPSWRSAARSLWVTLALTILSGLLGWLVAPTVWAVAMMLVILFPLNLVALASANLLKGTSRSDEVEASGLNQGVRPPEPVVRLFVSSTFADFNRERTLLNERVWPQLRESVRLQGAHFEPVDLRWGVPTEANREHSTMELCLTELATCREAGAPAVLALIGNRRGWIPVPRVVPADDWTALLTTVAEPVRQLALEWFKLDENALPSAWVLSPVRTDQEKSWALAEPILAGAFGKAVASLGFQGERFTRYASSATEQELHQALLGGGTGQMIAFVRDLAGESGDTRWVDSDQTHVRRTVGELRAAQKDGIVAEILAKPSEFSSDVRSYDDWFVQSTVNSLSRAIEARLSTGGVSPTPEAAEVVAARKARVLVGREEIIANIIDSPQQATKCVAILGGAGAGKSTIMAAAATAAAQQDRRAVVVTRFVGTPGAPSSADALWFGICIEAMAKLGLNQAMVPTDRSHLRQFVASTVLGQASNRRPILILIDAIDELDDSDVVWEYLPKRLRYSGSVVVSTRTVPSWAEVDVVDVPMPSDGEAGEMFDRHLARMGRRVTVAQREEVLSATSRSRNNPLFIELAARRCAGWHSNDDYPTEIGQDHLVEQIVAEFTTQGHHGSVLVRKALGFLAATPSGLAPEEWDALITRDPDVYLEFLANTVQIPDDLALLAATEGIEEGRLWAKGHIDAVVLALSDDRLSLPFAVWSRTQRDLEFLVDHYGPRSTGRVRLIHRQVGEVLMREVLAPPEQQAIHDTLASFYLKRARTIDGSGWRSDTAGSERALRQLPRHLALANRTEDLLRLVEDVKFLEAWTEATGGRVSVLATLAEQVRVVAGGIDTLPAANSSSLTTLYEFGTRKTSGFRPAGSP
jgi:hypothetical protein